MTNKSDGFSRRGFLGLAGSVSAGLILAGSASLVKAQPFPKATKKGTLKGFIVSDAHFGWKDERQPKPEEQVEMMRRILHNIPDLDVMIDTGDAHHNYAKLPDLGNWTDVIAGGCGQLPFYYVAGNHEIGHNSDCDRETRSNRLGSVSCRPYYSFDLKGIHFISLPEMLGANFVTEEALSWAELDLKVHRNQTTIILSHNSIANTTFHHDDRGYRSIANSDRVLELIRRHPWVVGWMHGHNHTWEVVKRWDKLFVSNGRIGGFPPKDERYAGSKLGGIYFEVDAQQVLVRGYSATDEGFLDEINPGLWGWLKQSLELKTSFDADAPPSQCWGIGGAKDGERLAVYHHHAAAAGKTELYLAGAADPVFSENSEMKAYGVRPEGQRMLPAVDVHSGNIPQEQAWQWIFPGLLLNRTPGPDQQIEVTVPSTSDMKNAYYHCAPGKRFKAVLEVKCLGAGPSAGFRWDVFGNDKQRVTGLDVAAVPLLEGKIILETKFDVPEFKDLPSIYSDTTLDDQFQIGVTAIFGNLTAEVEVRRLELSLDTDVVKTLDPAVAVDGKACKASGEFDMERIERFDLPPIAGERSVVTCAAKGNGRVTWLVRQEAPRWQVRNAAVAWAAGQLIIGAMRNDFSPKEEIIIVPLAEPKGPWLHRTRHAQNITVTPAKKAGAALTMDVKTVLNGPAELEVICPAKPQKVDGATTWDYQDGRAIIKLAAAGQVTISC